MTAFKPPSDVEGVKANMLKKMLGLLTADDAVMLEDRQRTLSMNRAQNRWHHDNMARMQGTEPPQWEPEQSDAEDDDMGIHVGDIYQNIQVPGTSPEAIVAGKAAASLKAEIAKAKAAAAAVEPTSKWKKALGAGLLVAAACAAPWAYTELVALFSAAAEIKVLWDGEEIKPGGTATGEAEKTTTP
jgi:hypothetical protein